MRPYQDDLPPQFLCDYGGFEHDTDFLYTDKSRIAEVLRRYHQAELALQGSQYAYDMQGISVILYSIGAHRCAYLALPHSPTPDQIAKFKNAYTTAAALDPHDYALLKNNCVTTTAKILHCLNATISEKAWFPFFQFSGLEKQEGITKIVHDDGVDPTFFHDEADVAIARTFIATYDEATKKWHQRKHWSPTHPLTSLTALYEHAIGLYAGSGERTKKCLLSLRWIQEDENTGLLLATENTPLHFAHTIESLMPLAIMRWLSQQYDDCGGSAKSRIALFHQENNIILLLKDLADHAKKNPKGASHLTLMKLASWIESPEDNPLKLFFPPILSCDHLITCISSDDHPLISITPRQFIDMIASGISDFMQVRFQETARETIENDMRLQHAFIELSLTNITVSGDMATTLLGFVSFANARIIGAHFLADFPDSLLSHDCSSTTFKNTVFDGITFSNTHFTYARLSNCHFIDCSFFQVTFEKATMLRCKFTKCDIQQTNLNCLFSFGQAGKNKTHFVECDISDSSFTQNASDDFQFSNCSLVNIDMTGFYLHPTEKTFCDCTFSDIKTTAVRLVIDNEELFFPIDAGLLTEFANIAKELQPEKTSETQAGLTAYVHGFFAKMDPTRSFAHLSGYAKTKTHFDRFLCALYASNELREKLVGYVNTTGARLLLEKHCTQPVAT